MEQAEAGSARGALGQTCCGAEGSPILLRWPLRSRGLQAVHPPLPLDAEPDFSPEELRMALIKRWFISVRRDLGLAWVPASCSRSFFFFSSLWHGWRAGR